METGSRFTIVAVAEGAISKEDAALSKKEYKKKLAERTSRRSSTTSPRDRGQDRRETRVAIPGHTQRGGSPTLRTASLRPSVASRRRWAACAASLAT